MEIKKTFEGDKATFAIEGWLDTQTAPELGAALDELGDDVKQLEFDFAKLEYVSSAGIRQIVAAHKKMGGNLTVRNVSPAVLEVLRLTGVDKRLGIVWHRVALRQKQDHRIVPRHDAHHHRGDGDYRFPIHAVARARDFRQDGLDRGAIMRIDAGVRQRDRDLGPKLGGLQGVPPGHARFVQKQPHGLHVRVSLQSRKRHDHLPVLRSRRRQKRCGDGG